MKYGDRQRNKDQIRPFVRKKTNYKISDSTELNFYEISQVAQNVLIQYKDTMITTMLQGRINIRLNDLNTLHFLPGECLILPANEIAYVDFPEANKNIPTTALVLTLSEQKIKTTIDFLNRHLPKENQKKWQFSDYNFHFSNDPSIHLILKRLLFILSEDHSSKDIFAEQMLQELIIRILQVKTKSLYHMEFFNGGKNDRLSHIIQYIRENLDKPLNIEELSQKIYMSESNFYRVFKNETGCSPIEFINNERIKLAIQLLNQTDLSIKKIYTTCGFNSLSYFNRLFKKKMNMTPRAYKLHSQRSNE